MEFRALTEKEIDARVATVNEKGCSLLLYKDARCDMRILDESVGSERWQRKHELINGNLFCNVGINFPAEDGDHWVWKQDVGTESYTEKEKGQASDSFKRACFNLGIGRELYTAPDIWIPAKHVNLKEGRNGKLTTYDGFYVEQVIIEKKKIVALSIKNKTTKKRVFLYDTRPPKEEETK